MSKRERLTMPTVKNWLHSQLPKLIEIREATHKQQVHEDIDLVLITPNGELTCEVKIRYQNYNDFSIETINNIHTRSPGWFFKSTAQVLVYVFVNEATQSIKRGYIMHFPNLRSWYDDEGGFEISYKRIRSPTYHNRGKYISENVIIPWSHLPDDVYARKRQ